MVKQFQVRSEAADHELEDEVVRGTWVAQTVERPTFDFDTGHDLMVREFELHVRLCTDSMDPAWNSLSPSLSAPPLFMLSLSLSQINKEIKK